MFSGEGVVKNKSQKTLLHFKYKINNSKICIFHDISVSTFPKNKNIQSTYS